MRWREIRESVAHSGWLRTGYDLGYRVFNRLTTRRVFWGIALSVEMAERVEERRVDRYERRFLDRDVLERYALDPLYELTPRFLEDALAKGDRCLATLDGEILANYGWCSTVPTRLTHDLIVDRAPEWVYRYKGFTHPSYRGQRLNAKTQVATVREYGREGYRGIVGLIEVNNSRSLQSVRHNEVKEIGRIFVWKWFGRYRIRVEPGCAAYGLTVRPATPARD